MLASIVFAIFCIQAGVFARSLDSTLLSQILNLREEKQPIIIVVANPEDDSSEDDTLRVKRPVMRAGVDCKAMLREKLKTKCPQANCKKIIWQAAEILCDDPSDTTLADLHKFLRSL